MLMDDQGEELEAEISETWSLASASLGQMVSFIHDSFSFCIKPGDVDTLWLHETQSK